MNKPNIMLISIDTLRADHLSCYGYHRRTTPNIDQFAQDSVLFNNAYSTAVWTPPAHASMLTGLYPSQHGVVDQNRLSRNIATIAETLSQNGYQAAGFVNNSQVGEMVGLEIGHGDFHEIWKGLASKQIFKRFIHKTKFWLNYTDKGADYTNHLVKKWLENKWDQRKPFYLFIHFIEPHNPLGAPKPYRNRFFREFTKQKLDKNLLRKYAHNPLVHYLSDSKLTDIENKALMALYDEEILYLDSKIGELLSHLKVLNLHNDSLIIITADHGEHFGEHDMYSHVASLYESILHIPLIIHYPDSSSLNHRIENKMVQLIDITPTIIGTANIRGNNPYKYCGLDLNDCGTLNENRALFAQWEGRIPSFIAKHIEFLGNERINKISRKLVSIIKNGHKFITDTDNKEELYDLKSDHMEIHNLCEKKSDVKIMLRDELNSWLNKIQTPQNAQKINYDKKLVENLRELGYL
jgi:arylsulfatase A-like enzyme